jgi:hypothetical protein
LGQYKDMEKTIQAMMDALKRKEDALAAREQEMLLRENEQLRSPSQRVAAVLAPTPLAAVASGGAAGPAGEGEDLDDNVISALRRIKSLPLGGRKVEARPRSTYIHGGAHDAVWGGRGRAQGRSTSARLVTGAGPPPGSNGSPLTRNDAFSPISPSSSGGLSTATPAETPLSALSHVGTSDTLTHTPTRTPILAGLEPRLVIDPGTPSSTAKDGRPRELTALAGLDTEPPQPSPRSAASGPSDSDSVTSPGPTPADDDEVAAGAGELTVVARPKQRMPSVSSASSSSDAGGSAPTPETATASPGPLAAIAPALARVAGSADADGGEATVVAPTVQGRPAPSPSASPTAPTRRFFVRAPNVSASMLPDNPVLPMPRAHAREDSSDSPTAPFFAPALSRTASNADSPVQSFHSAHSREPSSSAAATEGIGSPQPAPAHLSGSSKSAAQSTDSVRSRANSNASQQASGSGGLLGFFTRARTSSATGASLAAGMAANATGTLSPVHEEAERSKTPR